MKSFFSILIFFFLIIPLGAQEELLDFARYSDRTLNEIITRYLEEGDFGQAQLISRGLAGREDPYISDILISLWIGPLKTAEKEALIGIIINDFFYSSEIGEARFMKVDENLEALEFLLRHIRVIKDYNLKASLINLLPLFPFPWYRSPVMTEWKKVLIELEKSVDQEIYRELEAILNVVASLNPEEFREPLVRTIMLSRDKRITAKARTILLDSKK